MNEPRKRLAAVRTKTLPWDPADYLEDSGDIVAYLEAAFEDGDPQTITGAVGDVARSRGMTEVAAKSGFGRESLYKALSRDGNPGFATVLGVLEALGLRLHPSLAGDELAVAIRDEETGWDGGFVLPPGDFYVLTGDPPSGSARRVSDYR